MSRREEIKDFLKENPGWRTAKEISQNVGTSPDNINHIAGDMCCKKSSEIEKAKDGNQNQYKYKG